MSPAARLAIAAALAMLAWRSIHVNAVVYDEHNRPVTRPAPGMAPGLAATRALHANAADVRALLLVARDKDASGDAAGSAAAYGRALALAPVDRVALHEAAAWDLRNGRIAEAIVRMDLLASHHPETRPAVFDVFGRMLARPEHRALVEERAARGPEWAGAFVIFACGRLDPLHAAPLFMRRAASGKAPPEEARCVIDRLRRAGHWPVAYQAWLNSLPRARLADVGHVFNGGFEHPASGVGFDWIVAEDAAQAVEFTPAPGASGQRALRVTYSGSRIAAPALRQYLALSPGRYELSGRVKLEGLSSVRGVRWTLRCEAPGRAPLASSERFLGSVPWRAFAAAATVPAECPGQVLALEPEGLDEGTTFVSGSALFDELRLARAR